MKPWFEKEGKTGKGMEGRKTATDLWDIKSAIQKQCWGRDAALVSWWISGVRILEHWEHHSQPRHNSSLITISTSAAQQNKLSHYKQRKAACSSWVELGDRSGAQFCDPRCHERAVLIRWSTDSTALKALPNFLCCESWEGGERRSVCPEVSISSLVSFGVGEKTKSCLRVGDLSALSSDWDDAMLYHLPGKNSPSKQTAMWKGESARLHLKIPALWLHLNFAPVPHYDKILRKSRLIRKTFSHQHMQSEPELSQLLRASSVGLA